MIRRIRATRGLLTPWWLGLAVIVVTTDVQAQSRPAFAPLPQIADHVRTVAVTSYLGHPPSSLLTVAHQGHWTRFDTTYGGHAASVHFSHQSNATFQIQRLPNGELLSLNIRRGIRQGWEFLEQRDLTRTRRSESFLNERCDVWETGWTSRYDNMPQFRTSCVTHDGIERWAEWRIRGRLGTRMEVEVLERRSVEPTHVEVPSQALDPATWLASTAEARPNRYSSNFVMTLEAQSSVLREYVTRVVQRQGDDWCVTEALLSSGATRVSGQHAPTMVRFFWARSAAGELNELRISREPHLTHFSYNCARGDPRTLGFRPVTPPRWEGMFGQVCQWYDVTPGTHDAGALECITPDGISLIQRWPGRATDYRRVVTTFERRPVRPNEAPSLAELLSRHAWGIPD